MNQGCSTIWGKSRHCGHCIGSWDVFQNSKKYVILVSNATAWFRVLRTSFLHWSPRTCTVCSLAGPSHTLPPQLKVRSALCIETPVASQAVLLEWTATAIAKTGASDERPQPPLPSAADEWRGVEGRKCLDGVEDPPNGSSGLRARRPWTHVRGVLGPLALDPPQLTKPLALLPTQMADRTYLFTSESVNEGHPDKICDQVSDAVLDAIIAQDEAARVACETCTKTGMIMIFGEITTTATVNYEQVIRDKLRDIGYDDPDKGLDYKTVNVIVAIEEQSPDIGQAVDSAHILELGAGDQGIMFGYACDETPSMMPLTHELATRLGKKLTEVRKDKTLPWVRPDGKTQVTVEYKDIDGVPQPQRVHTVVISTQHDEDVTNEQIRADLLAHVIGPVCSEYDCKPDDNTIYHINPSGRFVIGGPHGDAGLTGRKIIIDTYGGWGAHGGGAFSGKDTSKVDRSAAYAARWVAKSLVAAGLCRRVLVQLSYAIGISYPLSVYVNTYGTATDGRTDFDISDIVGKNFDLRPGAIIRDLKLRRPVLQETAAYGHFGREDTDRFTWEAPKALTF
eukprot:scaffold2420_cov259-Pinguiococcus_pyrenoidosus.AAC.2